VDGAAAAEAVRKAVEGEGEYFALLLDFYVKSKCGMGLELVAHDRRKFDSALAGLLGEDFAKPIEARIDSELAKLRPSPRSRNQQG
jgi:hypothetical protein